jgi:hypothetical protein
MKLRYCELRSSHCGEFKVTGEDKKQYYLAANPMPKEKYLFMASAFVR